MNKAMYIVLLVWFLYRVCYLCSVCEKIRLIIGILDVTIFCFCWYIKDNKSICEWYQAHNTYTDRGFLFICILVLMVDIHTHINIWNRRNQQNIYGPLCPTRHWSYIKIWTDLSLHWIYLAGCLHIVLCVLCNCLSGLHMVFLIKNGVGREGGYNTGKY